MSMSNEKITDDNVHQHQHYTLDAANADARQVLLNSFAGTLATCIRDGEALAGYPFNSITSFMLDSLGCPVMFGAGISEHAKNARENGRASLLVRDVSKHHRIETGWRLTLTGDIVSICDDDDLERCKTAFFRHYPHMRSYQSMHDFGFWRLVPKTLYLIMDFGKIRWVAPDDVLLESTISEQAQQDVIEHMNEDHVDAMLHYLELLGVELIEKKKPRLAGIQQLGMTLHYDQRLYYLPFEKPIEDASQLRQAFVALAHKPLV